jgi:hypothetical protein
MKKKVLTIMWITLLTAGFLLSCSTEGMTDEEFSRGLMDKCVDSSGLDAPPANGIVYDQDGLTIEINEDPPGSGLYAATITFTDFTPPFAAASTVNGVLNSVITVDLVAQPVTITFVGTLIVTGENAGAYVFDAELIFHIDTGEYEYSGTVTVDGKVYTLS